MFSAKYTSGYIDIRQLTINQHETPKCGQRRVRWQHSCSTAIGETFIHTTLSIPLRILSPVKGRAYRAPFSNGCFYMTHIFLHNFIERQSSSLFIILFCNQYPCVLLYRIQTSSDSIAINLDG